MMKMDGSPKQGLHCLGPEQERMFIHDGLQVTQLMRQAELSRMSQGQTAHGGKPAQI